MITQYALIASLSASVGLGGFAWVSHSKAERLETQIGNLEAKLTTCSARVENILEDMESDNEVDNTTDDELRDALKRWLLPEGTTDYN